MTAPQLIELLKACEMPDSAWVTELIERGPVNGEGGGCHGWLYKAARALHLYRFRHRMTKGQIFILLRAKADGYSRDVPDSEIEEAIESAVRDANAGNNKSATPRQPKWPRPNFQRVDEIVRAGFGLREFMEASPIDLACSPATSAQVVSCLFHGNPLICAGIDKENVITKPLCEWINGEYWRNERLSQQSFIVPSKMTGLQGRNQKGMLASRCLDNTGPREYLVVECDISKFGRDGKTPSSWKPWVERWETEGLTVLDASAAILWHLNQYAPLALAAHSGGKSIHGWFPCLGVAEDKLRRFMEYAVMLGADHATWNRCQLVRMPGGTRANGKRQRVLYFNPEALKISAEAVA